MITSTKNLEKYCKDYQNIQNYEDAVKSPLKYDLHHRREISENKSRKDLIAENLYYNRPATELIFLERGEHQRLHNRGDKNPLFGQHRSAETRQKIAEGMKGKHPSAETRQKISIARKGKHLPPEWRAKLSANSAWKGKPAHNKRKHRHIENGHYVYTD